MSKRGDRLDHELVGNSPSRAHASAVDPSTKPESSAPASSRNKRRASGSGTAPLAMSGPSSGAPTSMGAEEPSMTSSPTGPPPAKKSRTNTPWTPAEEQRLRTMRDAGNSWADIAKVGCAEVEVGVTQEGTEDMHYAEFAEDESQALLNAIKEYDANKWKAIGTKLGKPAKVLLTLHAKGALADVYIGMRAKGEVFVRMSLAPPKTYLGASISHVHFKKALAPDPSNLSQTTPF
ncbi:hypothetical protein D0Z07_1844 [Hyphodiscus hymeniophilus]|uniref:Myb-like domain-containing protein n=1 Tax=Hyphodiscus hymeniophilus TaxID=353542 RepID=A0A9P6VNG8_9HELO|nr:hypothetical protein D0Z07_1844 [Hyphodiscus hymeniophilus]